MCWACADRAPSDRIGNGKAGFEMGSGSQGGLTAGWGERKGVGRWEGGLCRQGKSVNLKAIKFFKQSALLKPLKQVSLDFNPQLGQSDRHCTFLIARTALEPGENRIMCFFFQIVKMTSFVLEGGSPTTNYFLVADM